MDDGSIRYYTAQVTRDLFDMIVLTRWGTVGTKRGSQKSQPVSSEEEAETMMLGIKKRRMSRGYELV